MNNPPKLNGVAMAIAAAGLIGCVHASDGQPSTGTVVAANDTTDLVHCYDVNICKGHNDCKTADNACAGQASCEGTGFVAMPSKACADVGGEVRDDFRGTVQTADLVHCHDVNICKGHNDCKTADHACAGQGSCKGTGFVAMPEKSCKDIGGDVG